MAGFGPPPKHRSQRRNRTAPSRGEWVDLPPLDKPVLDELPDLEGVDWRPMTRATWDAWRLDPATRMWSPADVAYALDAILLHNAMETPSAANEVRLRMDGLGLTPKGKRNLRWRPVEEAPTEVVPIRSLSRDVRRERLTKGGSSA